MVLVGMVDVTIFSNVFKVSQVGSDSGFESHCSRFFLYKLVALTRQLKKKIIILFSFRRGILCFVFRTRFKLVMNLGFIFSCEY